MLMLSEQPTQRVVLPAWQNQRSPVQHSCDIPTLRAIIVSMLIWGAYDVYLLSVLVQGTEPGRL